jgi:hypothetical protein
MSMAQAQELPASVELPGLPRLPASLAGRRSLADTHPPGSLANAPPRLSSLCAMRRAVAGSLVRGSLFDGDDTSVTR